MNKLFLLALLGLGLGGGIWKAQNPDASLDDLKSQATGTVQRLSAGVSTVITHPEQQAEEASLADRLSSLEQQIQTGGNDQRTEELQALLDARLAESADSMSSLQETINDRAVPMEAMTAAVAELDTALQDTRARTDAGTVRLDAIDRRLELLVRRLDEQTTGEDMQALQQSIDNLQTRVDTAEQNFIESSGQLDDKLAVVTEQNGNLGLRLDTLASSAGTTEDTAGSSDDDATASGNPSLQALSSSIDGRLSAIEQRLSSVNSDSRRISNLMQELEEARNKITELEQQDVQANLSLQNLTTSVSALTTVGESLSIDSIQAQIKDQLALAQSQFDSSAANSSTSQIEALLETTRNRIQTLEQRVQSLPASSAEADGALQAQDALEKQIAELDQRLESLTSTDPALVNEVNDVKQQVERLSAKGFVTQDELLRARQESESIEYKIYFDSNSAEVTADAARVLNSFIVQEKNRTIGVSIFGFTDRSGSAAYNQQLALQRATNVRSYLIQNGLDFTKIIALSGLGEDAAAAVLPDNSDDAQQRVVVLYAAQP